MGWYVAALQLLIVVAVLAVLWFKNAKKALRYAVTLKNSEGAFIGLCIKKRYRTWTFVDVKVQPTNPGGAVAQAAAGELHVPSRNILYYQEIQENANAVE